MRRGGVVVSGNLRSRSAKLIQDNTNSATINLLKNNHET
jgi:hypothetical protein